MAYLQTAFSSTDHRFGFDVQQTSKPSSAFVRTAVLRNVDREIVLEFLNERPVHTVAMSSFIYDNGFESPLNRGKFYGCFDRRGKLAGVALIGHTTLVEARTEESLTALAAIARRYANEIHMIMSSDEVAMDFWAEIGIAGTEPRLVCRERLFEINFPFPVQECTYDLRLATDAELEQVASAQAEVAFLESGVDPMVRDREGFLNRVLRRIQQGRVYVVVENGKVLFKADVVSMTPETAYLEGIYVAEEKRGNGVGALCLSEVARRLLSCVSNVCLLSNVDFQSAHRSFHKAGFRSSGECTTIFV